MAKRKLNNDNLPNKKKAKTSHWSLGLLEAVKQPELLIHEDPYTYVIKDKFPKAQYHYLVVSKKDISSISKVTTNDIDTLKHMEEVAKKIIDDLGTLEKNVTFKIGYHAQPSMARLHLHLISDDMNSPNMKTKKHWNSFTTNFFIPSENIIGSLVKDGTISLPSEKQCKNFLTEDLKCNRCGQTFKTIPALKKHILQHLEV